LQKQNPRNLTAENGFGMNEDTQTVYGTPIGLSLGKQYIIYEDDASRYIVGYGMFSNATTDRPIKIFDAAIKKNGRPRQVLSDHGTQFSSDDEKIFRFKEHLKSKGVELIKARVKHPQTNGKLEKLNHTSKILLKQFDDDLDKTVKFYNHVRPHMSLYNSHTRTPYKAYKDKRKKKNANQSKKVTNKPNQNPREELNSGQHIFFIILVGMS
jgi:hypothetical protein